jgi:hypothetical protein
MAKIILNLLENSPCSIEQNNILNSNIFSKHFQRNFHVIKESQSSDNVQRSVSFCLDGLKQTKLIHLVTQWILCTTALPDKFHMELHHVAWSALWNFLVFSLRDSFMKSRPTFYSFNGNKNFFEPLRRVTPFVKLVAVADKFHLTAP